MHVPTRDPVVTPPCSIGWGVGRRRAVGGRTHRPAADRPDTVHRVRAVTGRPGPTNGSRSRRPLSRPDGRSDNRHYVTSTGGAPPPLGSAIVQVVPVVRARWAVLAAFTLLVASTQLLWLGFAPVTSYVGRALGVSD